jgi:hypothetical protein
MDEINLGFYIPIRAIFSVRDTRTLRESGFTWIWELTECRQEMLEAEFQRDLYDRIREVLHLCGLSPNLKLGPEIRSRLPGYNALLEECH